MTDNDEEIARALTTQGMATSPRQVKECAYLATGVREITCLRNKNNDNRQLLR